MIERRGASSSSIGLLRACLWQRLVADRSDRLEVMGEEFGGAMPHGDVVIIGAGAIGCSIAYHLGKRGMRTTVVERESIGTRVR